MAHKRGAQPKPLLPSLVYAPPPPPLSSSERGGQLPPHHTSRGGRGLNSPRERLTGASEGGGECLEGEGGGG